MNSKPTNHWLIASGTVSEEIQALSLLSVKHGSDVNYCSRTGDVDHACTLGLFGSHL